MTKLLNTLPNLLIDDLNIKVVNNRILIIIFALTISFTILLIRLFDLTIIGGDKNTSFEQTDIPIIARTNVIDRNGVLLATNL